MGRKDSASSRLYSTALLLGVFTFASMILGLVRDRLLASYFGAGPELDAYLAAFRIPDLVYGILITGGISASFLPVLAEQFAEGNREKAWEFVNNVLNAVTLAFLLLAGAIALVAPFLITLIVPGFDGGLQMFVVDLTRAMLVGTVFLGVSSVFSGVLQYTDRFFFFAAAPVLYNLGIVAGIVLLAPALGVWGAAIGVVAGAFLHAAVQVPAARAAGFSWRPVLRLRNRALCEVFVLALPRTLGAVTYYLNLIAMTALASLLSAGSVTVFTFANTMHAVPVRLVGSSFALASFASLSRAFSEDRPGTFARTFAESFRMIVFLAVPAAILLFVLRNPIVSLVYRTGAFGEEAARMTAAVLGAFSFGIVFYALIPFLVRAFFARHRTVLPTVIGIGSVALNVALAFFLFSALPSAESGIAAMLGFAGDSRLLALPLAMGAAGAAQAAFLLAFLWRDIRQEKEEIIGSVSRTAVSALAMAGAFLLLPPSLISSIPGAAAAALSGTVAYGAAALLLRSPEMRRMLSLP